MFSFETCQTCVALRWERLQKKGLNLFALIALLFRPVSTFDLIPSNLLFLFLLLTFSDCTFLPILSLVTVLLLDDALVEVLVVPWEEEEVEIEVEVGVSSSSFFFFSNLSLARRDLNIWVLVILTLGPLKDFFFLLLFRGLWIPFEAHEGTKCFLLLFLIGFVPFPRIFQ